MDAYFDWEMKKDEYIWNVLAEHSESKGDVAASYEHLWIGKVTPQSFTTGSANPLKRRIQI